MSGRARRASSGGRTAAPSRERDGVFVSGGDVTATNEKTRFTPVGSSFDLPELEHGVLELWERDRSFEALKKKNAGGPRYSFIDAPLTPHVEALRGHHACGRPHKELYQPLKALQRC